MRKVRVAGRALAFLLSAGLVAGGISACRQGRRVDRLTHQVLNEIDRRWAPVVRASGSGAPERVCPERSDVFGAVEVVCADTERPLRGEWADATAREVRHLVAVSPEDAATERLAALWALLWSRTAEERELAVDRFDRLADATSGLGGSLLDAGFAHALAAALDDRPGERLRALELVDRALELGAEAEAELDRALLLTTFGLWREAESAWQVLRKRGGSWAETADRYRAVLPPLPEASRPIAENEREAGERALGAWAESRQRGELSTAAASLALAAALGARAASHGDRLLGDTVGMAQETQANAEDQDGELGALVRAHATFSRARGEMPYSSCGADLDQAERDLEAARSPFRHWARLDRAICAYFSKDFAAVEDLLDELDAAAAASGYISLAARAEWVRGLLRLVEGRFAEADLALRAASERFAGLGEAEHAVYLRSLRAKNFELSGLAGRAWQERLPALLGRHRLTDPERVYTIVEEAAQAVARQGESSARYFLEEQVRAAERAAEDGRDPDLVAYALLDRARAHRAAGEPADALAGVDAADLWIGRLAPDQESLERLRHESAVERALAARGTKLEERLRAFEEALDFLTGRSADEGDRTEVLRLLAERADVEIAAGRAADAAATLDLGLREIEERRAEFSDAEEAARFAVWADRLFERTIRLELDHLGRPDEALRRVEQRAGFAGERQNFSGAVANSARHTASRLGATILRYGHLPDRLLVWVIEPDGIRLESKIVPLHELRRLIQALRTAILRRDSDSLDTLRRDLTHLAWPSSLHEAAANRSLIVIPDESVVDLPFELLAPDAGDQLVLERYSLSYAPSLALLQTPDGQSSREPRPVGALFIGDPAFAEALFPQLPRLPSARQEIGRLASYYAEAEVLSGAAATRSAVLAALPRVSIVHVSSHGLVDPRRPHLGGVVLATDPVSSSRDASLLRGSDLVALDLKHLEVVILAACSTSFGTFPDSAQISGLAASFLSRGAHRVITARWQVDDAETARFFEAFHSRLAAGLPAQAALRATQLEAIRARAGGPSAAATWGAFQIHQTATSGK